MKPAPLCDLADARAWQAAQQAAQQAARRAPHGQRQAARRRLRQITHQMLARDVRAARKGRGRC